MARLLPVLPHWRRGIKPSAFKKGVIGNCLDTQSEESLGVTLTCIAARDVDLEKLGHAVANVKAKAENRIAVSAAEIRRNIHSYELFFHRYGHTCPITSQFDQALVRGLPNIFPAVDLLVAVELSHGVLAGIQDLAKTQGSLRLELANAGESFDGMRFLSTCRQGEVVVRDAKGIIASLFLGPDKRTKLRSTSTDLLVLLFAVPATLPQSISDAIDAFCAVLDTCCRDCVVQKNALTV